MLAHGHLKKRCIWLRPRLCLLNWIAQACSSRFAQLWDLFSLSCIYIYILILPHSLNKSRCAYTADISWHKKNTMKDIGISYMTFATVLLAGIYSTWVTAGYSASRAVEKKAFASYTGPNVRMCLVYARAFLCKVSHVCKVSHANVLKLYYTFAKYMPFHVLACCFWKPSEGFWIIHKISMQSRYKSYTKAFQSMRGSIVNILSR